MTRRVYGTGALLFLAACGSNGGQAAPRAGAGNPSATTSALNEHVELTVEPSGRKSFRLGAPTKVALGASLMSVADSELALVIADYAGEPLGFAQLVDENGPFGPVVTLADEHPVFAFAQERGVTLLLSSSGAFCPVVIEKEKAERKPCFRADGDAFVRVAGRLALLDVRSKQEADESIEAGTKIGPRVVPSASAKPPAPKPKPPSVTNGRKPPKKKRKPLSDEQLKKRLYASGREVVVDACWIDEAAEEPFATGLAFREAMAGMGFIGAVARNARVDVAFYEANEKSTKEPEGKLGYAQLDSTLLLDPPTRRSFGESKMNPGFLSDHAEMRLLTQPEGSLLLGLRGPRGKCDVTFVGPFVMQLIPDDPACTIDPRRLVLTARARHKGEPFQPGQLPALDPSKVARTMGQANFDVGRVVYSGARAYTFEGEQLVTFKDDQAPKSVIALEAQRAPLFWGVFAPDGAGLAEASSGLFAVSSDAKEPTLLPQREPPRFLGRKRRDVRELNRQSAVRIAGRWWQAEGELRQLHPELQPPLRRLARDAEAVVGGTTSGLVVSRAHHGLLVQTLASEGTLSEPALHPAKLGPRLVATQRAAGGALIASRTGERQVLLIALDQRGQLLGTNSITPPVEDDGLSALQLSPLPTGGALLYPRSQRWVSWLSDEAMLTASSAWLDRPMSACLDGRRLAARLPTPNPQVFVEPSGQDEATACIQGEFQWAADGTVRWFGTRMIGPSSQAEFVVSEVFPTAVTTVSVPAASTLAPVPAAPSTARCPADMVLVGADLCVDRYEGTLADPNGVFVSPDYPATPDLFKYVLGDWATRRERGGDLHARALPLPLIGEGQRSADGMLAESLPGVRPSGTVTGKLAKQACENSHKRLCTTAEWQRACRGEQDTLFPYGSHYQPDFCNSKTRLHPAATLHDHAGMGHHDPRLNRVKDGPTTLLLETASLPRCKSVWGNDAIFDMVGNLDEWVDEKGGGFAGGFYARGSESGCESLITVHPPAYSDYSTGLRCCRSAE
jgi:hypothetical protein